MEILETFLYTKKEDYYEPVRIESFYSNNYIKYESNGDRNKTLSIEEYINNATLNRASQIKSACGRGQFAQNQTAWKLQNRNFGGKIVGGDMEGQEILGLVGGRVSPLGETLL